MEETYYCKKCGNPVDDIAEAMVTGCACGCRVFTQRKPTPVEPISEPNEEMNEQVSIKVKATGVYNLNLAALVKRESDDDPLFVEDQKGKINVIFNPNT
ncbi:MAG: hypothetical protein ACXAE3_11270 [Candidatus Kariarchaeaceae archaeon]|jgi:predicted  nucleic acid-binding Zn-ribbon protein